MPPDLAAQYLKKGREDETLLERIAKDPAVSDSIYGFHAQQAVEKYLKAVLAHLQVRVRKVHDLQYLLQQLADAGATDLPDVDVADSFTIFAVEDRYPFGEVGLPASREEILTFVSGVRVWAETAISGR